MKKNKIIIYGDGGHATSCIDLIESTNLFKIIGIVSNKSFKTFNSYPIIGTDRELSNLKKITKNIVIGISFYKDLKKRNKIFSKLKNLGFNIPTLCSPLSYISKGVKIGEGSQIFHRVVINKNVIIESNCIVNNQSLIEHDVKIKNNSHISTSVTINGGCTIGQEVFIGTGSILRENLWIKNNSFIKMGSILKK
jgi:sugar O-acyltransferase (sialic acid O-acetyltransferase NeuD family)